MVMKNRIPQVDFLKGLAMLMVVWAHCGMVASPIINYFHMPLFFFISGYLFNKNDFGVFLKKKIIGLYLPFLIYETIFLLFRNIFLELGMYSTTDWSWMEPVNDKNIWRFIEHILLFDNVDELLSPLWFPMALFSVEVLFFLLLKYVNSHICRLMISLGLLLLGYCLCEIGVQVNSYSFDKKISVILISVYFYSLGYIFKEEKLLNFQNNSDKLITKKSAALLFFVIIFLFVAYRLYIYTDYRACSFNNPLISLILACCGIYATIKIGNLLYTWLEGRKNKVGLYIINCINQVGINSFHFMALQFLAMKPISYFVAKLMGYNPKICVGEFGITIIANQPMRFAAFLLVVCELYIVSFLLGKLKEKIKGYWHFYEKNECGINKK